MFYLCKYNKTAICIFTFVLAVTLNFSTYANTPSQLSPNKVIFEKNDGQLGEDVLYSAYGLPFLTYFKNNHVQIILDTSTQDKKAEDIITVSFVGAKEAKLRGVHPLPSKSHFYSGQTQIENISHYEKVRYHSLYEDTDIVFYNNQGDLQYDFILAPGAKPEKIKIAIEGAKKLNLDDQGQLVMHLQNDHRFVMKMPYVYQLDENQKQQVIPASYQLKDNLISFQLGKYDDTRPLIIDPQLIFSTFVGGNGNEGSLRGKGADETGIAFCNQSSNSTNLPFDHQYGGNHSVYILCAKLDPDGNVVYLTRVGIPTVANLIGATYALSHDGRLLMAGSTTSLNFPVTANAAQSSNVGSLDVVVFALDNNDGTLNYASYLGSPLADQPLGIFGDSEGNIYVTGQARAGFLSSIGITPTKIGPVDQNSTGALAFVTKINSQGNVDFTTLIAGATNPFPTVPANIGQDIATDEMGNIYVVGTTRTSDFPTTPGAFLPNRPLQNFNVPDGFFIKLDPTGTHLLYSSYIGGTLIHPSVIGTSGNSVSILPGGKAVIILHASAPQLPLTSNAFDTTLGQAFVKSGVLILNPLGNGSQDLEYSSYLGGSSQNAVFDCWRSEVDKFHNIYLGCYSSNSMDFPHTLPPPQSTNFAQKTLVVLNPIFAPADQLVFSTSLGGTLNNTQSSGVGIDGKGNMYALATTFASDFPVFNAAQPTFGGLSDVVVSKFHIWDEIVIDIQPGQTKNVLPIHSSGLVEVAILSSPSLNAPAVIDPKSIILAGAKVKLIGKTESPLCQNKDVNNDNLPDLVCKIEIKDMTTTLGATEAVLMAKSSTGQIYFGKDQITIVP